MRKRNKNYCNDQTINKNSGVRAEFSEQKNDTKWKYFLKFYITWEKEWNINTFWNQHWRNTAKCRGSRKEDSHYKNTENIHSKNCGFKKQIQIQSQAHLVTNK